MALKQERTFVIISAAVAVIAIVTMLAVVLSWNGSNSSSTSGTSLTEAQGPTFPAPSSSISPTLSLSPSSSPSASPVPTSTPSVSPTNLPTLQPPTSEPTVSPEPTDGPSRSPTHEPTEFPTDNPSNEPSLSLEPTVSPSFEPSFEPTEHPSLLPSSEPSVSAAPSFSELDPNFEFALKMYWEKGYYWQESSKEEKYCIECTDCSKINFSETPNCKKVSSCSNNDQIWIQDCDSDAQNFVAVYVGAFMQIKVKDDDLCLTRTEKHYITVQSCNVNDTTQLWKPISAYTKFELSPAYLGPDDDSPYCMTQHHHPKPGEVIGLKRCTQGHKYDTGYWVTY